METRRIRRPKRVPTPAIEVRLCDEHGKLLNISAGGALVRAEAPLPAGRECPLIIKSGQQRAQAKVRVVWARPAAAGGRDGDEDYLLAVRFTELSTLAKQAVRALCGPALASRE